MELKYLRRYIKSSFWRLISLSIRPFIRLKDNQIICWVYYNNHYTDSPRVFTEYILSNHSNDFNIVWVFTKEFDTSGIDPRIKVVRTNTLKYLISLYSSKVIISNRRTFRYLDYFYKKKGQTYIMTWHGSFPLKRIEKDAENVLTKSYIREAKYDSSICDLMLSNSRMYSEVIRNAFWYDGEILEMGIPRNDIFYNHKLISETYVNIRKEYDVSADTKIVIYAPTFRTDSSNLDYYRINWSKIIPCFESLFNSKVVVFIRLHPNMSSINGIEDLINDSRVIDITKKPDITPYLFASDAMISDYTSAMFDFCTLRRPCFVFATDKDSYDRGFNLSLEDLPFPLSINQNQLITSILNFDYKSYMMKLDSFIDNTWGLFEKGDSTEALYYWINNKIK